MANLIECPTCKKQVSSNASACPNCGEIINQKMNKPAGAFNLKDPVHLIGVASLVLIVLAIIVALFMAKNSSL